MVNIEELSVGDILRDTAMPGLTRIWEIILVEEDAITFRLQSEGFHSTAGYETRTAKSRLRPEKLHWIEIAPW